MAVDFDLLAEVTETSGAPGNEGRVREHLPGVVDRVRTDAMGDPVATVESERDPGGDHKPKYSVPGVP